MQGSGHQGGHERQGHEPERSVGAGARQELRHGRSDREPERERGGEAPQRARGGAQVDGTGAPHQACDHQHGCEQRDQGHVLHRGDREHAAGERSARVQLVLDRDRDDRRRGGGHGAERQRDAECVPEGLVHREREPAAHTQEHQRQDAEWEQNRARGEPPQPNPLRAQRRQRQGAAGGECDERHAGVHHEAEGADLVGTHHLEPRRAERQADEQERCDARQPGAPRRHAGEPGGDQQQPEGERGPAFERACRGEVMKKGHHQAQGDQARDPSHGAEICARRAF